MAPTSSGASRTRPTPAALASIRRPLTWPSSEKHWAGGVALEAVDEAALLAACRRRRGCAGCGAARSGRAAARSPRRCRAGRAAARPRRGRAGAARCRRRPRRAQTSTRRSLRTDSSPPPPVPCFGVTLKAVWPGRNDAAQRARVDLHRQQLVVGGLADLHVAAGERRAGAEVERHRRAARAPPAPRR